MLGALLVPAISLADTNAYEDIGTQLQAVGGEKGAGMSQTDPRTTAALLVRSLISLLGTIVFGYYIYGGFLWTTAGGNDEQVSKAQTAIRNATIGLILVMMSYSITLAAVDVATGWPIGTSGGPVGWMRNLINSF